MNNSNLMLERVQDSPPVNEARFRRLPFGASIAVALLAACGGSQPTTGPAGFMPQSHAVTLHAKRSGPFMPLDAKVIANYKVEGSLLYVTNFTNDVVKIFNHTLVATIQAPGYGQNAGLVFIGSARSSNIGPGIFDEVYGGKAFVEGALAIGMKGGCRASKSVSA